MNISTHARTRMRQRGLSEADARFIMENGSEVTDGYFLRDKDVQRLERAYRKKIEKSHRLKGKFLAMPGETLLSAYHPRKDKTKKLTRDL